MFAIPSEKPFKLAKEVPGAYSLLLKYVSTVPETLNVGSSCACALVIPPNTRKATSAERVIKDDKLYFFMFNSFIKVWVNLNKKIIYTLKTFFLQRSVNQIICLKMTQYNCTSI